jgi:hypothetical protein
MEAICEVGQGGRLGDVLVGTEGIGFFSLLIAEP